MLEASDGPTTVDEYIQSFPMEVQKVLQGLRAAIREAAPAAEERIRYQIPTYFLAGNLVHFAAWKHHVGFYPQPSGLQQFDKELADYSRSKGSVQFPLGEPLPLDLIQRIVRFRVSENLKKAEART